MYKVWLLVEHWNVQANHDNVTQCVEAIEDSRHFLFLWKSAFRLVESARTREETLFFDLGRSLKYIKYG